MEYYKTNIADNDKVEFIHVSKDSDKDAAVKWAKSASFPWLTVLESKVKSSGLAKFDAGSVPGYKLIDKDGKLLASSKSACKAKIKELTGK